MEQLIISPLKKASASLEVALNQPLNEFTRDASIQRFEYTFELAWKMIKRYLKEVAGIEKHNLKDIFREAARIELIENLDHWFDYQQARNLTSHTYNEITAEETYAVTKPFLQDVKILISNLERLSNA